MAMLASHSPLPVPVNGAAAQERVPRIAIDHDAKVHPVKPMTTPEADETISCSVSTFQGIVQDFLKKADFRIPQVSTDQVKQAQQDAGAYFKLLPWPSETIDRAWKIVCYVSDGVVRSYSFLDRPALRDVTIFSTFLFLVDDGGDQMKSDLESFAMDLMLRRDPSHPILKSYLDFLPALRARWGRYATDMFFVSTMQFFDGCLLEQRPTDCFRNLAGAVEFPKFFRLKTGYAEPYAHFVFSESVFPEESFLQIYHPVIPYLGDFVNFTNDLMSFYKESILSDERSTFIYNMARAKEVSIEQSLRDAATTALECIRVVRAVLAQHPQLLETAESFLQGYIAYHVTSPRYKLARLLDVPSL